MGLAIWAMSGNSSSEGKTENESKEKMMKGINIV